MHLHRIPHRQDDLEQNFDGRGGASEVVFQDLMPLKDGANELHVELSVPAPWKARQHWWDRCDRVQPLLFPPKRPIWPNWTQT